MLRMNNDKHSAPVETPLISSKTLRTSNPCWVILHLKQRVWLSDGWGMRCRRRFHFKSPDISFTTEPCRWLLRWKR